MANLKELFPEFYQAKVDISDLSKESGNLIVLDTNYLLDIIQQPTRVSKKYIEALEKVKDNIYVPYLVALEFNFRKSTIKKDKRYKIRKYQDDVENSIKNIKINIEKIDLINAKEEKDLFTKELFELTDSYSESLKQMIHDKIQDSVFREEEELYSRLISVIEDTIGDKYNQDWINEVENQGKQRYADGIPPGFNDQTKEEEKDSIRYYGNLQYQRKYGDLIIWKDIINFAKNCKKTWNKVIFVTNDGQSKKKSDLLYRVNNLIVGPNIYLMNELQIEAQKELYILSNLRFLQLVGDLSDIQIEEIKSISEPEYKVKIPNDEIPNLLERLSELNSRSDKFNYGINDEGNIYTKDKKNLANDNDNDNDRHQRNLLRKQFIENYSKRHTNPTKQEREISERNLLSSLSSDDYMNNINNWEFFDYEKIKDNLFFDSKREKYPTKKDLNEVIFRKYLQQLQNDDIENIVDYDFGDEI